MTHNALENYLIKSDQHEMSKHLQKVADFIAEIRLKYYEIVK
jgi:hypothetical protein